jgi:predicted Abi (CAAX) family protease
MKNIGLEEKEIDEDDTLNVVNDPDATEDGMGIFEEDKNIAKASSICHSQVGPKKSRKWERCVKEVKKQLKEGKNPVSLFLESQIQKIVEKHMPPKITKGDLVKYISEQGTAPAPTTKPSPTTKPGTKPGKRPNPFKNPNPGENPAPKAKKVSPEDAKEKVIDVIMQLLEK